MGGGEVVSVPPIALSPYGLMSVSPYLLISLLGHHAGLNLHTEVLTRLLHAPVSFYEVHAMQLIVCMVHHIHTVYGIRT